MRNGFIEDAPAIPKEEFKVLFPDYKKSTKRSADGRFALVDSKRNTSVGFFSEEWTPEKETFFRLWIQAEGTKPVYVGYNAKPIEVEDY